jgi:competence protein ComEC
MCVVVGMPSFNARGASLLFSFSVLVAACSSATSSVDETGEQATISSTKIVTKAVSAAADLKATAPGAGAFRVNLIDVGTGLAMLIQGHDFTMLYDGGSNDDSRGIDATAVRRGNQSRLLAYLYATVGPSGGPECVPQGEQWQTGTDSPHRTIDHLFLSHAHRDHISMLGDVLHCYDVKNVWEPGAAYTDSQAYSDFFASVTAETGVKYHTAAAPPSPLPATFLGATLPDGFSWEGFAENDSIPLGHGANAKVLHADGAEHASDVNLNSLVLRLTLGKASMLIMGDAEAGERGAAASSPGAVEGDLLTRHKNELAVDIFQVGHHGSSTSSRSQFLDAVFPGPTRTRYALLSVGPTPYSGVTLPDQSVMDELTALAAHGVQLLRTNEHDPENGQSTCPTPDRIGMDDDSTGGCDNHVLEIAP